MTNHDATDDSATNERKYRQGKRVSTLRYRLGPLTRHSTYEAEAVGGALALELIGRERGVRLAIILLNNQSILQAVRNIQSRQAQYILGRIHNMADNIAATPSRRCQTTLRITWISGHDEVAANEDSDLEARKAAAGESS